MPVKLVCVTFRGAAVFSVLDTRIRVTLEAPEMLEVVPNLRKAVRVIWKLPRLRLTRKLNDAVV